MLWEKCFAIVSTELVETRPLQGVAKKVTLWVGVSLSVFMIVCALTVVPFYVFLTTYFGLTTVLVFMLYPPERTPPITSRLWTTF